MSDRTHNFPLEEPETLETSQPNRSRIGMAVLGALAVVLLLIGADVTIISAVQRPAPRPIVKRQVVRLTGTAQILQTIYMSLSPGVKPAVDGQLHDAFSVTSFTVRAGQPVKLVIDNTDNVDHSITSPAAGVNIIVRPGTHSYTLLVHKSGVFQWWCTFPCDPYSMSHNGYMRGTITSV